MSTIAQRAGWSETTLREAERILHAAHADVAMSAFVQGHSSLTPHEARLLCEGALLFRGMTAAIFESTVDLDALAPEALKDSSILQERYFFRHLSAYRLGIENDFWGNWEKALEAARAFPRVAFRIRVERAARQMNAGFLKQALTLLPSEAFSEVPWDPFLRTRHDTVRFGCFTALGRFSEARAVLHEMRPEPRAAASQHLAHLRRQLDLEIESEQLENAQKTLRLIDFQAMSSGVSQSLILASRVRLFLDLRENQAAQSNLEQAILAQRSRGLSHQFVNLIPEVAETYLRGGDLSLVESLCREAQDTLSRTPSAYLQTVVLLFQGRLSLRQQAFRQATRFLDEALQLARQEGYARLRVQTQLAFAQAAWAMGEPRGACDQLAELEHFSGKTPLPRSRALARWLRGVLDKPEEPASLLRQMLLHPGLREAVDEFFSIGEIQTRSAFRAAPPGRHATLWSEKMLRQQAENHLLWFPEERFLLVGPHPTKSLCLDDGLSSRLLDAFFQRKALTLADIHGLRASTPFARERHERAALSLLFRLRQLLAGVPLEIHYQRDKAVYEIRSRHFLVTCQPVSHSLGARTEHTQHQEQLILDAIRRNFPISTGELRQRLNLNRQTLWRYLAELRARGLVRTHVSGRRHYCFPG